MDFIFYKNFLFNKNDYNKVSIDLCDDQEIFYNDDFLLAYRPSTIALKNNTAAFLMSGHVQFKSFDKNTSTEYLRSYVNNNEWPLNDDFTGFFSGVSYSDNAIRIFTDPIGLLHLYYSVTDKYIIASTNLNAIHTITQNKLRLSALVLEITMPEFSQYGRATILENVFSLLPGEMVVIKDGKIKRNFDTTIKKEDKNGAYSLSFDLVELINREFGNFYHDTSRLMLSMSGGIDSRVNLAGLLSNNYKPILSNFGKPDYIDSKIPLKIARDFNLHIDVVDACNYQFPPLKTIEKVIKETDSLYINQWIALIDYYSDHLSHYPLFLLGDMCDIFRSKGISSLKTREFRIRYYIGKFLSGKKLKLTPIEERVKNVFKTKQRDLILSRATEALSTYLPSLLSQRKVLIEDLEGNVIELFNHLDRYSPAYLESYEELFGIFTHGRKSMGKQLNILKIAFTPEIPILNMRIVRNVLNYSPEYRYSDELTNKMFRHPSWHSLGRYPTAQNPFIPYNSNYYKMLLGWFIRSSIDQLMLKMHVLTKGKFKRQRLVKSGDILAEYLCNDAKKNFSDYFKADGFDASELLRRFSDRAEKRSWPLSGQDLIPFAQAVWYLKQFGN